MCAKALQKYTQSRTHPYYAPVIKKRWYKKHSTPTVVIIAFTLSQGAARSKATAVRATNVANMPQRYFPLEIQILCHSLNINLSLGILWRAASAAAVRIVAAAAAVRRNKNYDAAFQYTASSHCCNSTRAYVVYIHKCFVKLVRLAMVDSADGSFNVDHC